MLIFHETMAEEVALKRRRVTQACESCRSLKSKVGFWLLARDDS